MKYNLNQEVVQAQWGSKRLIYDRPFLIAMFVFLLSAFGAWKYTFNTPNSGGSGESGSSKYAMCSAVGASQANMQSKAHAGTVNAPVGSNIGGLKRWSAAGTWEGNTKPTLNDDVLIPANSVVVLDENINVKSLRIEGKLIVDLTKNISITTPYILVTGTKAYFEWGTETELYNMQGVITLTGSDKILKIPGTTVESKAILVGEGASLEFHGKNKTSWTNLDANAAAGTKTIKIADANNNWEVGDEILIAPSRLSWNEGEKKTIATISADKKTITLTAGLTYPHIGTIKTYKRQTDGKTWTGDMRAEVGLLSKSIKVQGDASSEMEGFGAHIMIHTEGKARVENTELYRMGQQGILARYPFHWHLLEEKGQGQYFKGNSVHRSFNRGLTIHGTESTVVENNFFYDHIGHGLFLEDGSERFNVIRGNVVLLTKRPKDGEELIPSDNEANEVQNRTPASYWITNPNNIFENNVAAGTQGTGFWFAMPKSPMAFSAVIPRFQNLEPYKEPLGKFYGNKAHSCVSGFDIFDQLTAKHALARNGAWQRTDLRLMEACTWYANDLAVYGGIGGGRAYTENVVFRDNVFMDNVTAIMHANYCLTEQSVFVANSGENVFTGERKLNRGYDGATSIKNCHLVGWQADNANYVQNTGGAMKHVNYRVSGLTMDHLGPPRMAFPDYSKIPKGGVGANAAENPRFWSYVHWDMDGSLAGKPNTSIITNHPLGRDGTEERYSNWTNLYRTDRRFAYLLIDAAGDPKMTLTRTKAGTPKVGQYYINDDAPGGFYGTFIHFPVIVNDGFLYTIQFESLGTNKSMTFHMKDDYVPGDEVLYKIKDFGRLPGVSISNASKKNTLAEVQSSGTTSYAIVGNDLYFMMVSKTTTPDFSCNITWTTNITLPMLDTDGDGISDYQESVNGTDPIPNDPIPTRPVLQLPKPVTAWEFNKAGDAESWTMAKSLTGSVSGGSHQLKVTGTDPQFNSPSNLFVPASDYGFLRFRMKSDKAGTLQIYYGTNEESNFTGSKVKVIAIEASPNDFVEYVVDMSTEASWTDFIYQLRLDPEVGLNGNVSIDHISFQKTNQLDCNKQWAGTATVNSCNKCVGGTTGLALNACDVVKAPYSGTAINIPGTIEAENFDKGGEGLGYSDTDTGNKGGAYRLSEGVDIAAITGGYTVGWTAVGEWLEYTVNVTTAGTYDIEFLTSSMNGGGEISLLLNGALVKDKISIPKTSDWALYESSTVRVVLPKGKKVLRLQIDKSGFNIDKMIFTSVITANEKNVELEEVSIFPNPSNTGIFHLTSSKNWEVYSTLGHLVAEGNGMDVNISTMAQGVYFIKLEETFYKVVKE